MAVSGGKSLQELWLKVRPRLSMVLEKVFETTDTMLKVHTSVGFKDFNKTIDPSIEEILLDLKLIEAVLDTLDAVGVLDYDETRRVMNAKQQIWNVQNVATSLQNGDEASYLEAMKRLDTQVAF